MRRMIDNYNAEVDQYAQVCQGRADKPDVAAAVNSDPRQIKWTRELLADPGRLRHHGSGTMFTNRNLLFRASIVRFRSSGFISIAASNRIRETSYGEFPLGSEFRVDPSQRGVPFPWTTVCFAQLPGSEPFGLAFGSFV